MMFVTYNVEPCLTEDEALFYRTTTRKLSQYRLVTIEKSTCHNLYIGFLKRI